MSATLKLTHKTIGAEIRRGTYDAVVDGKPVGSVELNETIDIPVEPGRHNLQVRNGRRSSRTKTFDVAEGEIASFRMRRKEHLADLSLVLPGSQPGTLAPSRVAHHASHRLASSLASTTQDVLALIAWSPYGTRWAQPMARVLLCGGR
jgi:hypothetical protein